MPSSSCHFCAHGNPADSKFCNQCGSPLDLKPCGQCDAMNHVSVDRCYQCGTAFASEDRALEVAEVGSSPLAVGAATADTRTVRSSPRPPLPPDRIPVALSDRMEASTERVAMRAEEAQPLKPFAEATPSDDIDVDDDDDWIDPRRLRAAERGLRASGRRHRVAQAALVGVSLFVIAAAGYYASDTGMLPRVVQMARAFTAADDPSVDRLSPTRPRADPASAAAPASVPAAPASALAAPASALAAPAPAPVIMPPTSMDNVSPSVSSASAPNATAAAVPVPAASPSAPLTTLPATRPEAIARGARASEPVPHAPRTASPARPASVDKDALATQRLIERDLAGFLPPEPQRRAPGR